MSDWRQPYRSMDASGGPECAGQVGWDWLRAIARAEHDRDPRGLELDHPINGDPKHAIIFRDCKPIAGYFIVRDPMNFSQLFRWVSPDLEVE